VFRLVHRTELGEFRSGPVVAVVASANQIILVPWRGSAGSEVVVVHLMVRLGLRRHHRRHLRGVTFTDPAGAVKVVS